MRYFDRGEVTDAWVILGSRARSHLQNVIRTGSMDYKALKWAALKNGTADQSALLLQLHNATVMEFSHSGAARVWGSSDNQTGKSQRIPMLHKSEYKAKELRAHCPEDQKFTHDPRGNWRLKIEACLARVTGRARRI